MIVTVLYTLQVEEPTLQSVQQFTSGSLQYIRTRQFTPYDQTTVQLTLPSEITQCFPNIRVLQGVQNVVHTASVIGHTTHSSVHTHGLNKRYRLREYNCYICTHPLTIVGRKQFDIIPFVTRYFTGQQCHIIFGTSDKELLEIVNTMER